MTEKLLKGLLLAAIFGGITYLITKDLGTVGLISLVMVLSMFARSREEKIQGAAKYAQQSKKTKKSKK